MPWSSLAKLLAPKRHFFVCVNERAPGAALPCCAHRGGWAVYEALLNAVAQSGLSREVWVTRTGCLVHCNMGVTAVLYPEGIWYGNLTPTDVPELVHEHLLGGRPVEHLLLHTAP